MQNGVGIFWYTYEIQFLEIENFFAHESNNFQKIFTREKRNPKNLFPVFGRVEIFASRIWKLEKFVLVENFLGKFGGW